MQTATQIHLPDVQAVYSGPEGRLWGLLMIERQLTYDALKIIGFDTALAGTLIQEMRFLQTLAEAGKIIQGLIVAQKTA